MGPFITAAIEGGPWVLLILCIAAFLLALSRGYLLTKDAVERIERRMEKDTDRVLKLYEKQIETAAMAGIKKDETIAKQAEQIDKLMAHSAVSAHALESIIEGAKRRGFLD